MSVSDLSVCSSPSSTLPQTHLLSIFSLSSHMLSTHVVSIGSSNLCQDTESLSSIKELPSFHSQSLSTLHTLFPCLPLIPCSLPHPLFDISLAISYAHLLCLSVSLVTFSLHLFPLYLPLSHQHWSLKAWMELIIIRRKKKTKQKQTKHWAWFLSKMIQPWNMMDCSLRALQPWENLVWEDYCDTNIHLINFSALNVSGCEHLHQQNAFDVKCKWICR